MPVKIVTYFYVLIEMTNKDANDRLLISALKSNPSILSLCNKELYQLPHTIGQLKNLRNILLKNNHLSDLPHELASLQKIEAINIGNNNFTALPNVLRYAASLKKLHLFNNSLEYLDPVCLQGLNNLTLLNLNNNKLKSIPGEINRLPYLEVLSLDNNQLYEIPDEVCQLSELKELRINNNLIKSLPADVSFLRSLVVLHVRQNSLEEIPDGIGQCVKLKSLDVSSNNIKSFPSGLVALRLDEFHCEENDLLKHVPVKSVQEHEAFSLKELTVRAIVTMTQDTKSPLRVEVKQYPELQGILKMALTCFVCGGPFLNTWLECVQFVEARKLFKTKSNTKEIPIRGMLCSYSCFNTNDHEFYGIASAEVEIPVTLSKSSLLS